MLAFLFTKLQKKISWLFLQLTGCINVFLQEGRHPLTGQRAADFRLLANQ